MDIIGYLAGICSAICFLPQSIKTIKTKEVVGFSTLTYVIYILAMVLWTIYGIQLKSIPMMIFNVISLCFALPILFIILSKNSKK